MRFSERIGAYQPPPIQLTEIDSRLRISIWNLMVETLRIKDEGGNWRHILKLLATDFFKYPVDKVPNYWPDEGLNWFREKFKILKWFEVYDLLEYCAKYADIISMGETNHDKFASGANLILEQERSGYRFIDKRLTPITNETEIESISQAVTQANKFGLEGAYIHMTTSLSHLSKRPEPDYRNAIKEAISAVESSAKTISGVSDGGLDLALKKLSRKAEIHGALRSGFLSLYGYSSDEDGIRHAILDSPNIGFDEAKFMIVACSAFVNFMISKAEAAGVLARKN